MVCALTPVCVPMPSQEAVGAPDYIRNQSPDDVATSMSDNFTQYYVEFFLCAIFMHPFN